MANYTISPKPAEDGSTAVLMRPATLFESIKLSWMLYKYPDKMAVLLYASPDTLKNNFGIDVSKYQEKP